MKIVSRPFLPAIFAIVAGCAAHTGVPPHEAALMQSKPPSRSPASIAVPPMRKTPILPASAMRSPSAEARRTDATGLNWSEVPGSAVQVAAASDNSVWALSSRPSGPDKFIWHYANGVWSNISGAASQISAAPDGTLYAINSGGGLYAYRSGAWSALGGGARSVAAAADNSIYVISNAGSGPDYAIWHNVQGAWTQAAGSGIALGTSFDGANYALPAGNLASDGVYVLNSSGGIWYENANQTFAHFSGAAWDVSAGTGGIFVLGYPQSAAGSTIWYYDFSSSSWSNTGGTASNVSAAGSTLYVVGGSNAIYSAPVSTATVITTIPPGWSVNPSLVTVNGNGAQQQIAVSESGYAGAFTAAVADATIATVAPSGPSGAFTVTGGTSGGTTRLTFTDANGAQAVVTIQNTATSVIIQKGTTP